jgi:hypothetical protein
MVEIVCSKDLIAFANSILEKCRSRKAKPAEKKKAKKASPKKTKTCKEGKTLNPLTGKCINIKKEKPCKEGKMRDQVSGKCIKIKVKRDLTDYQKFIKTTLPILKDFAPDQPQQTILREAAYRWNESQGIDIGTPKHDRSIFVAKNNRSSPKRSSPKRGSSKK